MRLSGNARITNTSGGTVIEARQIWEQWGLHQIIESKVFQGDATKAAGARVGTCLSVKESYYGTLRDSVVSDFAIGMLLEGVYPWWAEGVRWKNCDVAIKWKKYASGSGSANGVALRRQIFDHCGIGIQGGDPTNPDANLRAAVGSANHLYNAMGLDTGVIGQFSDSITAYSFKDGYYERPVTYGFNFDGSTSYPSRLVVISGNFFTGLQSSITSLIRTKGVRGFAVRDNAIALSDANARLVDVAGDNDEVIWHNNVVFNLATSAIIDLPALNVRANSGFLICDDEPRIHPESLLTILKTEAWSRTNTMTPALRRYTHRGDEYWLDYYEVTRASSTPSNALYYDIAISESGQYTFAVISASPEASKMRLKLRTAASSVGEVRRLDTLAIRPRIYTITQDYVAGDTARLQIDLGDNDTAAYSSKIAVAPIAFKKSGALLGKLEQELAAIRLGRKAITTAQRPALAGDLYAGLSFLDTTIGKPIWWSGAAWKDAAGTVV